MPSGGSVERLFFKSWTSPHGSPDSSQCLDSQLMLNFHSHVPVGHFTLHDSRGPQLGSVEKSGITKARRFVSASTIESLTRRWVNLTPATGDEKS